MVGIFLWLVDVDAVVAVLVGPPPLRKNRRPVIYAGLDDAADADVEDMEKDNVPHHKTAPHGAEEDNRERV